MLGVGGVMGANLPGGKCQKLRNLFESLRNVEGYLTAANELGTRLMNGGTGAALPDENQQTPEQRVELAKALLTRDQAFGNWVNRLY